MIEKYGTVIITEDSVRVQNFHFNGESLNGAQDSAILWAVKRLTEYLPKYERSCDALLAENKMMRERYHKIINLLAHVRININNEGNGLYSMDEIIADRLFAPLDEFNKEREAKLKER